MARIYIDTDELRALADAVRSTAGDIGGVNVGLARAWGPAFPPPIDLVWQRSRSAGVEARSAGTATQLWLQAAQLDIHAASVDTEQSIGRQIRSFLGRGPWWLKVAGVGIWATFRVRGRSTAPPPGLQSLLSRLTPVSPWPEFRLGRREDGGQLTSALTALRIALASLESTLRRWSAQDTRPGWVCVAPTPVRTDGGFGALWKRTPQFGWRVLSTVKKKIGLVSDLWSLARTTSDFLGFVAVETFSSDPNVRAMANREALAASTRGLQQSVNALVGLADIPMTVPKLGLAASDWVSGSNYYSYTELGTVISSPEGTFPRFKAGSGGGAGW